MSEPVEGNGHSNGNGNGNHLSDSERFDKFFKEKLALKGEKKVALFSHAAPDPDAIGAMLGMQYLLHHVYGLEADCFYDGEVSHPQNKAAVQLLDSHLLKVDTYNKNDYCLNVLVDTIPSNAGVGQQDIAFDVVIDHHKDLPNGKFDGLLIHHHTGSVCGIVYDMLKQFGICFNDEDEEHVKLATALLVGVITDTDYCLSQDTTQRDFKAQQELFSCRDVDALRKIVRFNRPMSWIKLKGAAINEVELDDGIAVVGLGVLTDEQRDVIADIASDMLTWGNVQTAIVFALFGGERIEASVRTNDPTIEIHALCAKLGGKHGQGGGKSCKGGYKKYLGCMQLDIDEEDDLKDQMWQVIKRREMNKIFKLIKK